VGAWTGLGKSRCENEKRILELEQKLMKQQVENLAIKTAEPRASEASEDRYYSPDDTGQLKQPL
jgi:hypothetical protein